MTKWRVCLCLLLITCVSFAGEGKKTVCLNMIVKDEEEVITRCLESVLPVIDTWVIVDTGSTDGTQKAIKKFLKGIPGELHERPWVNFGYNRQEALLLAKGKADYILFMDADDQLVFSDDFKLPDLTQDFYGIPSYQGESEFWFQRLVKADLNWVWEGVVHEDLLCKDPVEGLPLQGVKYVYLHDGARSKDPHKSQKDILLLEEEIKNHPENPRNFFYLARSYANANQFDKALACFEKRAQMGGNEQEIFSSKLMVGLIQNKFHFDSKIVEESFFKAYLNRPHRAEPLYYLACNLCEKGECEKSYKILRLAQELPSDITDYMCLEKWIYDYGVLLQLAVCAKHTGRYPEGVELCKQLLKQPNLPEKVKNEVDNLYEWHHQMNVKQVKKKIVALLSE